MLRRFRPHKLVLKPARESLRSLAQEFFPADASRGLRAVRHFLRCKDRDAGEQRSSVRGQKRVVEREGRQLWSTRARSLRTRPALGRQWSHPGARELSSWHLRFCQKECLARG